MKNQVDEHMVVSSADSYFPNSSPIQVSPVSLAWFNKNFCLTITIEVDYGEDNQSSGSSILCSIALIINEKHVEKYLKVKF